MTRRTRRYRGTRPDSGTRSASHALKTHAHTAGPSKRSGSSVPSTHAFSLECAPADFVVSQAVFSGASPARQIVLIGLDYGVAYELHAKEVAGSPGSFACKWSNDDGDVGTASLELMTNAGGDIALIGTYACVGTPGGYWAFSLFPDDDEEEAQ